MDKAKLEKEIFDLALPIVQQFECELVDVEFIKEDREWYLRVYIDKDEGINIDDCTKVSRILSDELDAADPIEYSYYLEVSSPGLDRPLKKDSDFQKFKGKKIKIKFEKPFEGKRTMIGTLIDFKENVLSIDVDGNLFQIDRSKTASVRLNDF